jgi:GTP-binding protein
MSIKIAILGRPNVGKSSIFNRLTGSKKALVHDKPGLTRDRKEGEFRISGRKYTIIDTAGMEKAENGSLESLMMEQSLVAAEEADLILFVVDGRTGMTAADEEFARIARKYKKRKILLVNKCENEKRSPGLYEAYKLGLGEPVAISAEHGLGFSDLYEEIEKSLELNEGDDLSEGALSEKPKMSIAIVGRPNAGKSTLFNSLLGENRSIVSDFAGTTRDAVYKEILYNDNVIKLVDTSGIRKKFKKGDYLEELSVEDSKRALNYANVCILMINAKEGIDKIDMQLADMVLSEGRAMVIAINKWDLLDDDEREAIEFDLDTKLNFSLSKARSCPILKIVAKRSKYNDLILSLCESVYENWNRKISTSKLNDWLADATAENIPPICGGRRVRLKFMNQVNIRPPRFNIYTSSNLKDFPESYKRYLINSLRERFDLKGVPIFLSMKKTSNPYTE